MGDKEILIRCECGSEVMAITYWSWNDGSDWFIDIMSYPMGLRFRDRVANAIRMIRGKEPKHSKECTIFNKDKAVRLRDFLNECIEVETSNV